MSTELPPNERPKAEITETAPSSGVSGSIVGGLVLIGLGAFFLLQTLGIIDQINFDFNWWALFILIPIVYTLNNAYQVYQRNGERVNREVRSKLVGAGILGVVFAALMFDLDWSRIWPLFLIIGGLGILFGNMHRRGE